MKLTKSRSGNAILNTIFGFGDEIIAIVCGLILPRFILKYFGSSYNGITTSISQFISCIALLKAGIGGVTKVALYGPLSQKNYKEISQIIIQTERFMRKIALIFAIAVIGFAAIYPFIIDNEFDWLFSFSLVLIISISTLAQYYFGFTYQMLLTADQKNWICLVVNSITYILNTIISVALIKLGFGIHIVKLGSAFVFVLGPLFYYFYSRKKYHVIKCELSSKNHLTQRWDAVGHAVAEFINNNTDVVLITFFLNLLEVSVYSVYHLVLQGIKKITNVLITGFGAAFGNMYTLGQHDLMKENLGIYEVIVFSVSTFLYSVTMVMIVPFIIIYTNGVEDVNYIRPTFAIIMCFAGAFGCYRIPYQTIVSAVGHYRQTRNGAFLEAILNIVLSVALIFKFGIVGVAIGTLAAAIFRSFQYAVYLHKNIINRSIAPFFVHTILSLGIIIGVYCISLIYINNNTSIVEWIVMALATSIVTGLLILTTNFIFFNKETKGMFRKVKNIIKKEAN